MGVCCLVFDIDKYIFLEYLFFSFHVTSCFMLFSNIFRKEIKIRGGGGGMDFFFRKTRLSHFMFSSRFMQFFYEFLKY